jgi:4,5-DOPA dioxygenase extradiol
MNAIENNVYNKMWKKLGEQLPAPKAILVISAHWETNGTKVLASEKPVTIHDFYGFPPQLFAQKYPAPGAPDLAELTRKQVTLANIEADHSWGFDHGTWSVLLPMYPEARIPVYQLSIDRSRGPRYHYEIAGQLKSLRKKGVMIVGSGNIVHNLGRVSWKSNVPYDWAVDFDKKVKDSIDTGEHQSLVDYHKWGSGAALAVPTNEHYLPLLYALGVRDPSENLQYFNESIDLGSVSMRSFLSGFKGSI